MNDKPKLTSVESLAVIIPATDIPERVEKLGTNVLLDSLDQNDNLPFIPPSEHDEEEDQLSAPEVLSKAELKDKWW